MAEQREERRQPRNVVPICRPIAVQLLAADGQPQTGWLTADILDVSVGGMCLLVSEEAAPALREEMPLRLDVRQQPSFGQPLIEAQLRWFVRSGLGITIGLMFAENLAALPQLEA